MKVLERSSARIIILGVLALVLGLFGCSESDQRTGEVTPGNGSGSHDAPSEGSTPDESDSSLPARPTISFLGTSLTAGFGLTESEAGFVEVLQSYLDSANLAYSVENFGESGSTSAGGLARLPTVLDSDPAVLVLELGANDGLRGQPTEALASNLSLIVEETQRRLPETDVVLLALEAPPNFGAAYTEAFRSVFGAVGERFGIAVSPFLLDGVAGLPEMNQPDGIHPTAEGHMRLAQNLWPTLEGLLRARCTEDGAC